MAEAQKVILDVDTGIDDAVAIALAACSPEIDLLAVTTLAGNVDIGRTTDNTLRVLSYLGRPDVPVYRGASRPLTKPARHAEHIHGSNGLGGVSLPDAGRSIGPLRGPAAMVRLTQDYPGEITLVCVGPLTNLAIALNVEPSLTHLVRRLVIMGGVFNSPGNVTEHSEFNCFVDPDAAAQVFSAPFSDVVVVGLDASHQAALPHEVWTAARIAPSRHARLLHAVYSDSFEVKGRSDCYLHDALALALTIDPTLAAYGSGTISVETEGELRGKTSLERGPNGARVATEVDVERFIGLIKERFKIE